MASDLRTTQSAPLSSAELHAAASQCHLTAAVFGKHGTDSLLDTAVVFLDEDNGGLAADVAARGYTFCGTMAVIAGKSDVQPEPGAFALAVMMYAGPVFAQKLGLHLKELQLQQKQTRL